MAEDVPREGQLCYPGQRLLLGLQEGEAFGPDQIPVLGAFALLPGQLPPPPPPGAVSYRARKLGPLLTDHPIKRPGFPTKLLPLKSYISSYFYI